jgi:predicted DNA-binding ribbon-helix-helix protein
MKEISGVRDQMLYELVTEIDRGRQQSNLSSAIRLFVLDYFKNGDTNGGGTPKQPQPFVETAL